MNKQQHLAPSKPALPERANLEHLRKKAKERLADLRRHRPGARLADAQLELARGLGFPSWRSLKAAFTELEAQGALAVGDWIGEPEGGVPLALRIRDESGRLRAQLDVPALGYFGDPVEALSISQGRMTFMVTVRGVNALFRGSWDRQASQWRGLFTHDGQTQALNLRRGVLRAPRVDGLDGLWDARVEDGSWLTFRIVTDEKGTFAWLSSSALPGRWFQARRIENESSRVTLEMKTLRVEGQLELDAGQRIKGRLFRQGRDGPVEFVRRSPGEPAPWPAATSIS